MKVGALDVDFCNLPFEERIKTISELGFKGVQFWFTSAELGFNVFPLWTWGSWKIPVKVTALKLTKKEIIRILKDNDVELTGIGNFELLGNEYQQISTLKQKKQIIEQVKSAIDFSHQIGSNIVIIGSGGSRDKPEDWPILVKMLKELCRYAEDKQITIAIENSTMFLVYDAEGLLKLIKEVNSEALKINFDTEIFF